MLVTIASVALALQMSSPPPVSSAAEPVVQQIQYRAYAHPPPCGHGWDLSARDGMCYPNGVLPREDQSAYQQYYRRGYGGPGYDDRGYGGGPEYGGRVYGRYPVPCGGHGVDLDIRDGRCYPTGTVPLRFQNRPQNYGRY